MSKERSGLKTAAGLIVAVLLLGVVTHWAFSSSGRPTGPATAPAPTVAQLRTAAKLNPGFKPAHPTQGRQANPAAKPTGGAKPAATAPTDVADEPSGPLGVPGMTEGQLRAAETVMLGPAHAAQHAQMREAAREDVSSAQSIAAVHAQIEDSQATAAAEPRAAGPPQSVGQWAAPFHIPIFAIASVMLPTGKVMWWAYPFGHAGDPSDNRAEAWLWDPSTGQTKEVDAPINPDTGKPANLWCSGQSFLADGRVLVTGGNLLYPDTPVNPSQPPTGYKGLNRTYTFNPFNETWTEQPAPAHGRWYPSQVEQADGRTVIMSGWDESGTDTQNKQIDLFTPSPNMNGVGTLQTIAQRGGAGLPPEGELYPRNFLMPSGRTLVAGPDPADTWDYTVGPASGNAFSWNDLPDFGNSRLWSTSVIEPGGPSGSSRVTITGGRPFQTTAATVSTATSETFDDANPGAGWQPGPSLNIGRSHANTVLLPDGSKAEIGGGIGTDGGTGQNAGQYAFDDDERQMELFDPATNTWRLGPAQAEGRAYHSTAILLPDARVLSAGDNFNGTLGGTDGTTSDTAEIYSPPYLFNSSGGLAARPTISSAPSSVNWGTGFTVGTPNSISRAVLMAPSATTHGYDTNEREVPLQITGKTSGAVNVVAPPSGTVAPPGYYMLFLLNDQGVPSVAKWIRVGTPSTNGAILGAKGKRPTLKKKGKKLIVPITCDSTDQCTGKAVVTMPAGGASASAAKKKKKGKKVVVAKGTFKIPAGKTSKVKLKLTKRGRAAVSKRGKVKGKLTITNTPANTSVSYKVKF